MSIRGAQEVLAEGAINLPRIADSINRFSGRLESIRLTPGSENSNHQELAAQEIEGAKISLDRLWRAWNLASDELNRTRPQLSKPNKLSLTTIVEIISDQSLDPDEKERLKKLAMDFLISDMHFTPSTDAEDVLLEALKRLYN